jgi:uncharacterized membrane protein
MSKSPDQHNGPGMGGRGVTRPMAQEQLREGPSQRGPGDGQGQPGEQHHPQHQPHDEPDQHGGQGGHHAMSHDDRLQMLHMHHKQTLWVYWTIVMLGFWLLAAPFSFGYMNESLWVDPSGDRGVWFSDQTHTELRAILMTVSDVVCGLALLVFGWRGLTPNRPVSLWICCLIGVWLTFAPVLFWAPTLGAYLNDALVGAWLIALAILIPGMPNMMMYMQMGDPQPPGWSYNPSSWPQRWIMIAMGFAGLLVSRYLAMFQLGYIDYVWDPFFGFNANTKQVLNSPMSHAWPISDAGLGSISYTFEFLMGFMGSPARWRTMPWMVAFFGVLVVPLGLTHIILVISQPVVVGDWCTMCLLAAAIMLPMIPLEVDEVVAMCQHVLRAKRRGDHDGSLWAIFWKGGQGDEAQADDRSPELMELPQRPGQVLLASIWGISFPWTLLVSAALGVWLMFVPSALGVEKPASHVEHLVGALIVTVSVIAMGEVVRIGRYLNLLLGLLVIGGPWFFDGATTASTVNAALVGLAVIALSIPRGPKTETYGTWDRWVR